MKGPVSVAAVVVLVGGLLAMGAGDAKREGGDSIAQLRERVRALERRVENLEKQLSGKLPTRRPVMRRSSRPSRDGGVPEGWRRREFNGVPYYVIPVGEKEGRSHRRSALRGRR